MDPLVAVAVLCETAAVTSLAMMFSDTAPPMLAATTPPWLLPPAPRAAYRQGLDRRTGGRHQADVAANHFGIVFDQGLDGIVDLIDRHRPGHGQRDRTGSAGCFPRSRDGHATAIGVDRRTVRRVERDRPIGRKRRASADVRVGGIRDRIQAHLAGDADLTGDCPADPNCGDVPTGIGRQADLRSEVQLGAIHRGACISQSPCSASRFPQSRPNWSPY